MNSLFPISHHKLLFLPLSLSYLYLSISDYTRFTLNIPPAAVPGEIAVMAKQEWQ